MNVKLTPDTSAPEWVDAPMPALLRFAGPIVVSMLSASAMTMVDTLMVSTLGTWALAGVGLGGIATFILICLPLGVLTGVKILASQAVGAGNHAVVKTYLAAGLVLGCVMALIAGAVSLAVADMLPSVSATAETGAAARTYLRIGALGALPYLIRIAVEQTRLALGDSKSPMYVNVFSNVCNVIANYVFIFVLDMGVAGAAYGTLLANVIGAVAILGVQLSDGFDFRGLRWQHLGGIWRLGLPTGIQYALEMGSFATMVVMLTNLSELDGAANQIAIQVLHFGFLPCMAIGQAASVMAGQAVGALRRDLVHVVMRKAMVPTLAYSLFASVAFFTLGPWIASQFTDDPALVELSTKLLYLAALFQMADGVNIVSRSVLQGTGDVRFCAWVGISLSWMMTPPLTWLLAYHYGLGALGGWLGLTLDVFVVTVVFWTRARGTRWYAAADRSLEELRAEAVVSSEQVV